MKIYFVSTNKHKQTEVAHYFAGSGVTVEKFEYEIQEILHFDIATIARDKALKAYERLGVPCAVEHGGVHIEALGGLPSGLSKIVWDKTGEQLCAWLPINQPRTATAHSVVGYCDGRKIKTYSGETLGTIANSARGAYAFQWDPIFIPDGTNLTYAELGFPAKETYSQARKAWMQLIADLK
ncbi:non-canonical purine NTP pyrophosphatase [Corallococcus sp. AB050B]|nr:non-canonical purine NTP pyrophosphatase [Corallococcus sp. AB050B]